MKLIELENKFNNTGINGNPVISNQELKELADRYNELYFYFDKREMIISSYFRNLRDNVFSMLRARGSKNV